MVGKVMMHREGRWVFCVDFICVALLRGSLDSVWLDRDYGPTSVSCQCKWAANDVRTAREAGALNAVPAPGHESCVPAERCERRQVTSDHPVTVY